MTEPTDKEARELDDIASALYWSLSIDTDRAFFVPEEEIQKIVAALREAEERGAKRREAFGRTRGPAGP